MSVLLVNILETFLGDVRKHNEEAEQIAFDCPACSEWANMPNGDGKGNLEVNYGRGIFRCWACSETNNMSGPITKLLRRYGNARLMANYLLIAPESATQKERKEFIVTYPEGYKRLSNCTGKEHKYDIAMKYLKDRGITPEIIKEYNIGFTTEGPFYNRIIIPSYDAEGKLNYFIARWFAPEFQKYKYINPEAEKEEIIFNENKINWDATIYIVEGVTDHIVIPNSIPLLGKYISPKLLDLLHDKAKAKVVIVLDDDAHADAERLYRELNFGDLRGRIRVCFPEDYDPSKLYEKFGYKGIITLLRTSRQL